MTDKVTRRLSITGLVQGVWYRESMRREAQRLGVTGWVRNRADGSVEAVVQGSAGAVEAIQRWAKQGPDEARVERVEATPAQGEFAAFEKRPTG
jgi:acylphosphatase